MGLLQPIRRRPLAVSSSKRPTVPRSALAATLIALVACAGHEGVTSQTSVSVDNIDASARVQGSSVEDVALGPMTFAVRVSRSAQVLYITDQLSLWSTNTHDQYAKWLAQRTPITEAEQQLLGEHARLRKATGYGPLERAFADTPAATISLAAARASQTGILSKLDAAREESVLTVIEVRVGPLIDEQDARLRAFREELSQHSQDVGRVLTDLGTFVGGVYEPHSIPLFLVANPDSRGGGGGYNGGVAWVEVGTPDTAKFTLEHEAFHIMLQRRTNDLDLAAATCGAGMSSHLLQEGIAYALAPGILHPPGTQPLVSDVEQARANGHPSGDSMVQIERLALSVRPALEAALANHGDFQTFLQVACKCWVALSAEKWP
jgi:hypothetical protein